MSICVTVSLEQRFDRTPDGRVWATGGFDARFWDPYLEVFDSVRAVARLKEVLEPPARSARADAPGVSFAAMPYYVGPVQYLARVPSITLAARAHGRAMDAYILRVPSPLAGYLAVQLKRRRHPYGVEVVGDPSDVFAPGTVDHPLRPVLRRWMTRIMRAQCRGACAASYVTERALQSRYRCGGPTFAVSDVLLVPGAVLPLPRVFLRPASRLVFVGSLEQLYKAPDVLLEAVARLVSAGIDLTLTMVGDGKYRALLERSPAASILGKRLRFLGSLPGAEAVRHELDTADVFVLPSRTEGLPRAMVEAMARALPCVGSRVGGIPELIPPEYQVEPGDPVQLAATISRLVADPARLNQASARNLECAGRFSTSVLRPRRAEFYRTVRNATEDFLVDRGSSKLSTSSRVSK